MSVHAARALIGWRKLSELLCKSMEGGEKHELPRFCIEVNVPRRHDALSLVRIKGARSALHIADRSHSLPAIARPHSLPPEVGVGPVL